MAHPFSVMFERALKKSTEDENLVLFEAEKLKKKGYRVTEIHEVLEKLRASLVDDKDEAVVAEAVEEFSRYLDRDDEEEDS
jgi:hypothetical protein